MCKNQLKILNRFWEKWEMSRPLRGDFFDSHCIGLIIFIKTTTIDVADLQTTVLNIGYFYRIRTFPIGNLPSWTPQVFHSDMHFFIICNKFHYYLLFQPSMCYNSVQKCVRENIGWLIFAIVLFCTVVITEI